MRHRFQNQSVEDRSSSHVLLNGHLDNNPLARVTRLVQQNPAATFAVALATGLLLGFWLKEKE
jgi:ElaB/YqjD/DUF883 family membrane-anchored ribosome-binding protein